MKFKNPWIDPRVINIRPAHAQAYLLQRNWKPLPQERPHFLPFDGPFSGDENPIVHVPTFETARDYTQRVIELISDIALAEQRYAGDVLNEMLQADCATVPVNGSMIPTVADATTP